ncbi:MAG: hypothetical protein PWP34_99 [Desulfuromonadales bacterium]|jgi:hypothetical protein|nr:hypothetical protein [Desulfuromonadales bacterium]
MVSAIQIFAAYESGDEKPSFGTGIRRGGTMADSQEGYRERVGFVPGWLAFNIKAPTMGGLDMGARISFCPTFDAKDVGKSKNSFGNQIDLREIFFTVDGNFGQVLAGKTLSLYQGGNILTDMTLWGYGAQGGIDGGGTPLGRIGYGYVYPQFNAQVRYTSPDLAGFKFAVGLYDPSVINGYTVEARETTLPRVESEFSYAGVFEGGSFKAWVSGMYQEAKFTGDSGLSGSVEAYGVAGGIQVLYKGFDVVLSGFENQGVGSLLMLDYDSLDASGEERDGRGYIAQVMYGFDNRWGKTKLGLSYGANIMDETSGDRQQRLAGTEVQIEEQNLFGVGAYHDINDHLKLILEYFYTDNQWFDGAGQQSHMVAVGTFFTW